MSFPSSFDVENWEHRKCPSCQASNWYQGQSGWDISDQPIDVIICWRCKNHFWCSECTDRDQEIVDLAKKAMGEPDPTTPTKMLQILVDAAADKYADLLMTIRKDEHPIILKSLEDLAGAINHVKSIIGDKDIIKNISLQ